MAINLLRNIKHLSTLPELIFFLNAKGFLGSSSNFFQFLKDNNNKFVDTEGVTLISHCSINIILIIRRKKKISINYRRSRIKIEFKQFKFILIHWN